MPLKKYGSWSLCKHRLHCIWRSSSNIVQYLMHNVSTLLHLNQLPFNSNKTVSLRKMVRTAPFEQTLEACQLAGILLAKEQESIFSHYGHT